MEARDGTFFSVSFDQFCKRLLQMIFGEGFALTIFRL